MQALFYDSFQGPISIETLADPSPTENGVVLEVKATGLCLSDWHGWMGHDVDIQLPHVPGHEMAGIIVGKGKGVRNWQIGDRVTLPFVGGCGRCAECQAGDHQVCPQQFQAGFTHWGSFADLVAIDYADVNLVRLPETISDVAATALGCRFATSFRAVVDQGQLRPGQWLAVHACGGVGLSAIMIAKALGAKVVAIDIDDKKLEFAKELGANVTINSMRETDVAAAVKDSSGGGVHVSIDALGHPDILFNSVSNLRRRGKHIQVGILAPSEANVAIPIDKVIAHELEIIGSHGMQAHRYPDMLRMIEQGLFSSERLVSETVSLAEAKDLIPVLHKESSLGMRVIVKN